MVATKKLNGKVYQLHSRHRTRSVARQIAKSIRDDGYYRFVRVIHGPEVAAPTRWSIYGRRKK